MHDLLTCAKRNGAQAYPKMPHERLAPNRWFESKTFVQFLKHALVIFLQRIGCEE